MSSPHHGARAGAGGAEQGSAGGPLELGLRVGRAPCHAPRAARLDHQDRRKPDEHGRPLPDCRRLRHRLHRGLARCGRHGLAGGGHRHLQLDLHRQLELHLKEFLHLHIILLIRLLILHLLLLANPNYPHIVLFLEVLNVMLHQNLQNIISHHYLLIFLDTNSLYFLFK